MYLLDTHVFLWWMVTPDKLAKRVRDLMQANPDRMFFSAVSAWEIAIKSAIGKLSGVPMSELVDTVRDQGFVSLPFTGEHAVAVYRLPQHHWDPFDRALVAQAETEGCKLISNDKKIAAYAVETLWR